MRARHPQTLRRILLALAGVAMLVAVSAVAGDPLGLRTDHRGHQGTRLTNKPRLSFTTGVLRQARLGAWELDNGLQLQLASDLEWRDEETGGVTYPTAGRLVMITGQKYGGTIYVRQATVLSRQRQVEVLQTRPVTEPGQAVPELPQ